MRGLRGTGARVKCFRFFLVLLFVAIGAGTALAQDLPTIVRVEEDWELVVGTPDIDSDAPQVTCVISPTGSVGSLYAAFDLNHQTLPSFVAGGLQLQTWDGETALGHRKFPVDAVITEPGETIRWTQSIEVVEGGVIFEITNGSSTAWGEFGAATTLGRLNAYDPAVSVANSGVGYGGNRVESLVLRRVRLVTSEGEILEDTTPRVVHGSE
jgi:hypothetical protein